MSKKKQKKDIDSKEKISVTEIIQKNYAWIIGGLTFFGIIVRNLLKFIEYITGFAYFSHFCIDHNLYNYQNENYFYELCLSIIFVLACISVFYCFKQIKDNTKKKEYIKSENIVDSLLIIIFNLYIVVTTPRQQVNLVSVIILTTILIIIEFILSLLIFKEEKDNSPIQLKRDLINGLKTIPFIVIILIGLHYAKINIDLNLYKQYRIINNNKVIVYSTIDYYITLDCTINNDELTIYKGSQEKIENNNIKSQLIKFDKVEIKMK